jgi:chemosensory pili system protein ChpA (sensor histidine kinase/response regulator)
MARVFIIDDDPVVCRLARHILKRAGHETLTFGDGLEALKTLEQSRPDVVITDLVMPGMTGLELLRRIRADARWQTLPVVVLTARSGMDEQRRAAQAGASHFLTKPFSSAQLLDEINRFVAPK